MRESYPSPLSTSAVVARSKSEAKSLFRKILAASPFIPRFCEDPTRYPVAKLFKLKTLEEGTKKIFNPLAGFARRTAGGGCPHINPSQLEVGTPPYFCSQFNSSLTFIFPCQGFLPRPWPSPGKISSLFGMPSE